MRISWSINDIYQLGTKWESAGRIGRMKKKDYTCGGPFDLGVDCIRDIYIIYIPLESPRLYLTLLLILPYSPREIVRLAHGPYM